MTREYLDTIKASETECECPARKVLEAADKKLSGITTAWEERKMYGQGTAAFLSVDTTFGQVRESAEAAYLIRAALSVPCPECDKLRDGIALANEGAQYYNRKAALAMAECDRLRAELAEALGKDPSTETI